MKRLIALAALMAPAPALAQDKDTSPARLIASYEAEAGRAVDPSAGKALFMADHSGGKPETPSCTSCHTKNPRASGQARTGKTIDPLAPSANAARFTETKKVEKWFGRNCNSVLGRDCTPAEKADIVAWLASL
jgi:mono/diheme cytochrome c family protein